MTGTRVVVAAAVSVLALGVTACSGDDPEPRVAPSSSSAPTSPSATGASTPNEPTMPPAAKGTDAAAAEAFVKFYWDMVNYAQATGDTTKLRSLGHKCVTCNRGIDSIERVYNTGGRIRGGRGTLSDVTARFLARDGAKRAVVEFALTNTKEVIDYPGTARDKTFPGGVLPYQLMIQSTPRGWRVLFLGEQ